MNAFVATSFCLNCAVLALTLSCALYKGSMGRWSILQMLWVIGFGSWAALLLWG